MPTGYCPPVQTQLVTVGVLQFFDLNIKNFKNTLELCACKQSINLEDFLFLNLKKRECYFFFLLMFCSFSVDHLSQAQLFLTQQKLQYVKNVENYTVRFLLKITTHAQGNLSNENRQCFTKRATSRV